MAQAETAFDIGRARVGGSDHDVVLAGRRVRMSFAGDAFEGVFARALASSTAVRMDDHRAALDVRLWDAASTGSAIRSESWLGLMLGPAGVIQDLSDDRYQVSLDVHASLMTAFDAQRGLAYHYAVDARLLPAWELTHPARLLWSAWGRANGMQLCHAGAVADEGSGALLCGPSGSGKSTVTLACLSSGFSSAGDDYVLVELARPDDGNPEVHSLYRSISLDEGHARTFPQLMPSSDGTFDMSAIRRKTVVFASGTGGRPDVGGSFPLVAVVVPRVGPAATSSWQRITAGAALRALAPSTMGQLGAFNADALQSMSSLCRSLPCYALRVGRDIDSIPTVVRQVLADALSVRPRSSDREPEVAAV